MTYFSYRHDFGTRGEAVYVGSRRIGRVIVKTDWRSRAMVSRTSVDLYRAVRLDGTTFPTLFASRHDAAEALHDVAQYGGPGGDGAGVADSRQ